MRQVNLPLIPNSSIDLGNCFSVFFSETEVIWSHGIECIGRHRRDEQDQYRLEIARMCAVCGVRQSVMARATGLHPNTVMAYVSRLLEHGSASFFVPSPVRGGSVLTAERLRECQRRLDEGRSRSETARLCGVRKNTLDKAVRDGRLEVRDAHRPGGSLPDERRRRSRSAAQGMGMGCTDVGLRLAASFGKLCGAPSVFLPARALADGGVLCAVPALVANGLYGFLPDLSPCSGRSFYYDLTHVMTLLAFMSLLRIKSAEALRREAPEEKGALPGLDRIPEVKCLRGRLAAVSSDRSAVEGWARRMSKLWMSSSPELTGMLYVDGHVRAYYGEKAVLPRRFFSRMRLCLRGVTDYWVNDMGGRPFFYVERQTSEGLLAVLREELVPRLLEDVPPPGADAWDAGASPRFTLVFDREGYSPAFFHEMWTRHRIACLTYRKRVDDAWPAEEFRPHAVRLANGAEETMMLAERRIALKCGTRADAPSLEAREIRRLADSGHQTSIVTTNMVLSVADTASGMFARWCQENFFHYMEEQFALDALPGSEPADFPRGKTLLNPAWKEASRQCRVSQGKLDRKKAEYATVALDMEGKAQKKAEELVQKKARLAEDIRNLEQDVAGAKARRKGIPRRIAYEALPEEEKFKGLEPTRKTLLDTVRMVAYRAETAMASTAREFLSAPDTARSWIATLMRASADIEPDEKAGILNVLVYPLGEERMNRMTEGLLETLNETQTVFPGTELVLHYSLLDKQENTT
jgi:hypothetical protein